MPAYRAYMSNQSSQRNQWLKGTYALLLDSGATDHIVSDPMLLSDYKLLNSPVTITVGNGQKLRVMGYGNLSISYGNTIVHFPHTLHVPAMKCNLLSVSALDVSGFITTIANRRAHIAHSSNPDICVLSATLIDNLYTIDMNDHRNKSALISASPLLLSETMQHIIVESVHDPHSEDFHNSIMQSFISALGPVYNSLGPMSVTQDKHTANPAAATTSTPLSPLFPQNNNHTSPSVPTQETMQQQPAPETGQPQQLASHMWHARLGHVAKTTLYRTLPAVKGIPVSPDDFAHVYDAPCEHCIAGRYPASSHPVRQHRCTAPLERVYMDCTGPYRKGWDGSVYTLNLVDEYSGYAHVFTINSKEQVPVCLKQAIDRLHQQAGTKIKEIRSDNGTEFGSAAVETLLGEYGILHTYSSPYTPQQNGVVERCNRSLAEITRSLLSHSGRSAFYWPSAYIHAAYLHNRRVSYNNPDKTRYELLTGSVPDLSKLRVWGCDAYYRDESPQSKFDPRGIPCIYIGHSETSPAYNVLLPNKRVQKEREDVTFSESAFGKTKHTDFTDTPATQFQQPMQPAAPEPAQPAAPEPAQPAAPEPENAAAGPSHTSDTPHNTTHPDSPVQQQQTRKRRKSSEIPREAPKVTTRSRSALTVQQGEGSVTDMETDTDKETDTEPVSVFVPIVYHCDLALPENYVIDHMAFILATTPAFAQNPLHAHMNPDCPVISPPPVAKYPDHPTPEPGKPLPIPATYQDAMASPNRDHWIKAMHEEYLALQNMNVFSVVDLPPGVRPLSSKWVYTYKLRENVIVRAKARLVARGFEQREGLDYDFLYAPTVSSSTIKMLLAYSAQTGAYIHQLDIKTAFLHGDLQHDIYLHLPEGCDDRSGKVWKLHKSLYGLKQAPREWYAKFASAMNDLGYTCSEDDASLFFKDVNGSRMFICVHVDDMLLVHKDPNVVKAAVQEIMSFFQVSDLDQASEYLGAKIEFKNGNVYFHQQKYAHSLVQKYLVRDNSDKQMHGNLPLPVGFVFRSIDSEYATHPDEKTPCDRQIYMQIVGSLLYLANITRPDIAYAVNQLCRYTHNPSKRHYQATQYILRYINSTSHYSLVYTPSNTSDLTAYCDASHTSCPDTFRSCTGYVFTIAGGAVAWQSHMQKTVSLSTAESEIMSILDCGKTGLWLQNLYYDIFMPSSPSTLSLKCGECFPRVRFDTTSKQIEKLKTAQLIYNDNESAIKVVNNNASVSHLTLKYCVKYFRWAKEKIQDGLLACQHVAGTANPADILTKFLPLEPFSRHRKSMGLQPLSHK